MANVLSASVTPRHDVTAVMEVWCDGCRDWYPQTSVHFLQFSRKSSKRRYSRRVRRVA